MNTNFPFNPLLSITESLKNISDNNFCKTCNSPQNYMQQDLEQMESLKSQIVLSQNSFKDSISPKKSELYLKSKQIDSPQQINDENKITKQISFRKNNKKTRDLFTTPERFKISTENKSVNENKISKQQIRSHILKTKSQIDQKHPKQNNQISQLFKDNTISNLTQKFEYLQDDIQTKSISIMLQQKSENESEKQQKILIPENIPVSPLKVRQKPNKSQGLNKNYSYKILQNYSTNIQKNNSQYKLLNRIKSDENFQNQFHQIQNQFKSPNKIKQFLNSKTQKKSKKFRQEENQNSALERNLIFEIHKCLKYFQIENSNKNNGLADIEMNKKQMIKILKKMKFLRESFSSTQTLNSDKFQNNSQEKLEKLVDLMWNITRSSLNKICIKNLTLFILAVYGIQLEQKTFDSNKVSKIQKSFVEFRKNKIFAESQLYQQKKTKNSSELLLKNHKNKIFAKALNLQQEGLLIDYNLENLKHTEFLRLQKQIKEIERQKKIKQQEENRMKKCTFKPQTNFTNKNQIKTKSKKEFELNIKINGKIEKIIVKQNQNLQSILDDMIKKHKLDYKKSSKLKQALLTHIK